MNNLPSLSLIVPIFNEALILPNLLQSLQSWQRSGVEIIFVDGGSQDGSVQQIQCAGFQCLQTLTGRAAQMNAGAQQAHGDWLLFLHADTCLPDRLQLPQQLFCQPLDQVESTKVWGFFAVKIASASWILKVVATCINLRSRCTAIATGDQALFVKRDVFIEMGGFPDQVLMEDIALSRQLKKFSRPQFVPVKVITSERRWQQQGVWKTIFLMWRLRFLYWCGVSPQKLVQAYRQDVR